MCDQQKPFCKACQKRGVECEGYTRYPVVLQWTPNGLKKRQRFEEVAGSEQTPRGESSPLSHQSSSPDATIVRYGSTSSRASSPASSTSDFAVSLPPQPGLGVFLLQQIQNKCLDTYLPPRGEVMIDVKKTWMYTMSTLSCPGNALESSFAALSLARVGVVMKDNDLIAQGRGQYANALTRLKKALYDPETAFQDRTLAAMRTLSIYEGISPTYASVPPGKVHEDGMAQWCRAAGPHSINTEFALQIFQDVRWSLMVHSIDAHKASILGSEEWLTIPWERFEKDALQELFDFGFDITAFLQLVDSTVISHDPGLLAQLPTTCFSIVDELETWRTNTWPSRYESPSSGSEDDSVDSGYTSSSTPQLSGCLEATCMIYYWWFKLVLNDALSSLNATSGREISLFSFDSSPVSGYPAVSQFAEIALSSNSLTLANNIVNAAPYLLADDTGWVGPQRLMFPLRASIQHLARARSPILLEAQSALKTLFGRLKPTC